MTFIGNDLVALKEKCNERSYSDEQYLNKILTPAEFQLLSVNKDIFYLPQLFWSCKESAYKIAVKTGLNICFVPQYFEVTSVSIKLQNKDETREIQGTIGFAEKKLFYQSQVHHDYIHTVALTDPAFFINITSHVEEKYMVCNSSETRRLLKQHLADKHSCKPENIDIIKNSDGIPCILINKKKAGYDLSLSHDGNFFSYTILEHHQTIYK